MRYLDVAIIVLVALLITLVIFLGFQYLSLRRAAIISGHQLWSSLVLKDHAPLPRIDADIIRPWMTFDYVNRLFGIPPDYLKAKLMVTDTHYPKVTISGYAKEIKQNQTTFLTELEQAVQTYTTSTSS